MMNLVLPAEADTNAKEIRITKEDIEILRRGCKAMVRTYKDQLFHCEYNSTSWMKWMERLDNAAVLEATFSDVLEALAAEDAEQAEDSES